MCYFACVTTVSADPHAQWAILKGLYPCMLWLETCSTHSI
jgi:hypothetical protein